jgi:hypothetical protein
MTQSQVRVWLDDLRPIPVGFDHWVKTAQDAIALLKCGTVSLISLDHDLGPPDAGTGYDVAKYIEQAAYFDEIPHLQRQIHSANPVGRHNMEAALRNADNYWKQHQE